MDTIKKHYKLIVLLVLLVLFVFIIGYLLGSYVTIKAVVKIAQGFVDIDYTLVQQAIYQYQNNLGVCFPPK